MRNFLKVMLVIVIIAIIGVLAYAGKYYFDDKKQTDANTQNQNNSVTTSPEKEEKKEENEPKDEPEEEPVEEPVDEPTEEPKEEKGEEPSNEENNVSDEDKARELAKKEYGTSEGVYFRIEQTLGNGIYEVSVRDNNTTAEYAWYTIDVRNGTVK